jgi:hypothetical protein
MSNDELKFSDVQDVEADNLDDLMIENDRGELVVVGNNESPRTFESVLVTINRRTGEQIRDFPGHPLIEAPTLIDWLTSNNLCASEVRCLHGIIMTPDTWDENINFSLNG